MGLFNLLFDLPGKIKRNILSYQIRHSKKPTTQPVTPPVGVGVVPNIGQTVNPNTTVPVAPVEPNELPEVEGLKQQLAEQSKEIERLKAMLQKSGKVGAVNASTDAVKFEKQNSFARDLEQRTADTAPGSEEYAAEKTKLLWEYGSPDDDTEETYDPYDDLTPEEKAAVDNGIIPR